MKFNMKTKIITVAFLVVILLCQGCASLSNPQSTAIFAIRSATATGTILALREHPEWRAQFETARDDVGALIAAGSLDFAQLESIIGQLPVNELHGSNARIVITNAGLLLDDYVKQSTALNRVAAVETVANAIYYGLNAALKQN